MDAVIKPLKVLIVDDNEDIRDVLRLFLEQHGFAIVTAADGVNAVRLAVSERPDLCLLDVDMPHMDGYAVCHLLKSQPETQNIRVIFLSGAYVKKRDVVEGMFVGGEDYITKPVNQAELLQRIEAVMARDQSITDNLPGRPAPTNPTKIE